MSRIIIVYSLICFKVAVLGSVNITNRCIRHVYTSRTSEADERER